MATGQHKAQKAEAESIDARPTKEFFIDMLVKDIDLKDAVLDLVDNSVDGARRLRGDGTFQGLHVRLKISDRALTIDDNCGGIAADVAIKYAFRFGRIGSAHELDLIKSVGHVGVGMKRAFFKLGRKFEVASRSERDSFDVVVPVDDWKAREDDWEFPFKRLQRNEPLRAEASRGTRIKVTELRDGVAAMFGSARFITQLENEIRSTHQAAMQRGLGISINGIALTTEESRLLASDHLHPAFREVSANGVDVKIYVGIDASAPREAGWYVYCNGRMVLEADRTAATGWDGTRVPNYHNQFARFRGYVFFESDDPARLPWTTTKSDVDVDSPLYRGILQQMVNMMRPVIDFLNTLDKEKESGKTVLDGIVNESRSMPLAVLPEREAFGFDAPRPSGPPMQRISSYMRPRHQVEAAKRRLGATSYRNVGELTFDYYYENECTEQ